MPAKSTTSYPLIRLNGRRRKYRIPVPPNIYQYVREHMHDLTLNELKTKLEVSKRIAQALRNGKPIKLSKLDVTILNSKIICFRQSCLGYLVRRTIGESRDRKLYIELNRYLAKVIAEMPESVAKIIRGGWTTKHLDSWRLCSPWQNQAYALLWLAELRRWYKLIHERYPEFDPVLFNGTGLFGKKLSDEKPDESKETTSAPVQEPRGKSVSSGRPRIPKDVFEDIILKAFLQGTMKAISRGRRAKSER